MIVTKNIKKRHKILLEEISKEIKLNEKYLSGSVVSETERLRWKKEARTESQRVAHEAY